MTSLIHSHAALRAILDGTGGSASLRYAIQMWRFTLDIWDPGRGNAAGVPPAACETCDAIPYLPFDPAAFGLELGIDSQVLDIGCLGGYGLYDVARRQQGLGRPVPRLLGIDVDPDSVRIGQATSDAWAEGLDVRFMQGGAERLPCADATCDLIICRLVLPYVRVVESLNEIVRVLRTGGIVLFQTHSFLYYSRQFCRSMGVSAVALYYLRPIVAGALFRLTHRQPRMRRMSEVAVSGGFLTELCTIRGLSSVWTGGFKPRPIAAFRKG